MVRLKKATLRNIINKECTAKRVPLIDEKFNKFLCSIILMYYSE